MSHTINVIRGALTLAAALAAVLAGTASAATDGGPILVAPGGCALQCIQKALVVTTSSAARVEIGTAVPAKVVVTARRLSATGGLVFGPPDALASHHVLRTERVLFLVSLKPSTTYRIFVSATDAEGRIASRAGTFATLPVATNVDPGPGGISSGLGCSVQCIRKAVPVAIGPTAAVFEVGTDTPSRVQVIASRDAAAHEVVSSATSPSLTRTWRTSATSLDPGTTYFLTIRATDAAGRTDLRQWTFETDERNVRVTLWKIEVISDGDKGAARGEVQFDYWAGGRWIDGETRFHKRSSGDVVTVHAAGTSRPGVSAILPANGGDPKIDIRVYGEECDGPALIKNCATEARSPDWVPTGGGDYGGDDTAVAGGAFSLLALLTGGSLPPGFGTTMPAGHDGYFAFETTQYHLKFRVYAYVDVIYG